MWGAHSTQQGAVAFIFSGKNRTYVLSILLHKNQDHIWHTSLRETDILQRTEPFFYLFNERQLLLGHTEVALLLLYGRKYKEASMRMPHL
jgi:hypothetical protein